MGGYFQGDEFYYGQWVADKRHGFGFLLNGLTLTDPKKGEYKAKTIYKGHF